MTALYPNIQVPRGLGLNMIMLPFLRTPCTVAMRPFIWFDQEKQVYAVGWQLIRGGTVAHLPRYRLSEVRYYHGDRASSKLAHERFQYLVKLYLHDLYVCDDRMLASPQDDEGPYGAVLGHSASYEHLRQLVTASIANLDEYDFEGGDA